MNHDINRTVGLNLPLDRFEIKKTIGVLPDGRAISWMGVDRKGNKVILRHYPPSAHNAAEKWLDRNWTGWARILEVKKGGGVCLVIREWINGRSFSKLMENRQDLPEEKLSRNIFHNLCMNLEPLSQQGEAHGALKPANLFIDENIIITDPLLTRDVISDVESTLASLVPGHPAYLTPEQLKNKDISPATDVYQAGCILFEWITGIPPFQDESPVLVCYQHLSQDPPGVRTIRKKISKDLENIIRKCLEKNPKDRFENPRQLAEALSPKRKISVFKRKLEPEKVTPETKQQDIHESKTIVLDRKTIEASMVKSESQQKDIMETVNTVILSRKEIKKALEMAQVKDSRQPQEADQKIKLTKFSEKHKKANKKKKIFLLFILFLVIIFGIAIILYFKGFI